MAEKFGLELEDGLSNKRQFSAHAPMIKMFVFACTTVAVSFVLSSAFSECRVQQIQRTYDQRLADLEQKLERTQSICDQEVAELTNYGETTYNEETDEEVIVQREKRQNSGSDSNTTLPETHPSPQTLAEQFGIPSARMAVLYGDPNAIQLKSNESAVTSPLRIRPSTSNYPTPVCSKGRMTNNLGDEWCRRTFGNHIYQLTGANNYFRYFAKASWMDQAESQRYYTVTASSGREYFRKVRVKQDGMYMITSSMRFMELRSPENTTITAAYNVMAVHQDGTNRRTISTCAHHHRGSSKDSGQKSFQCSTWQLAPLRADDEVYLTIGTHFWFEVAKETFFMALIKLNDETLEGTVNSIRG